METKQARNMRYVPRKRKLKPGRYRYIDGQWVPVQDLTPEQVASGRQDDAHGIVSPCSGIHPEQIPEFKRLYGHTGIKVCPETGNLTYPDRKTRLQHLKERGLVDLDEIPRRAVSIADARPDWRNSLAL